MVIFIGGLIGTGKSSLAKGLATKLGIYYYDVDRIKKEIYPTDPQYDHNLKNNIPFSDETRTKTFNRVVQDFAELSKTHQHIIVDETLHKKQLRDILLKGAQQYFGAYLIVWVKADEKKIKERLTSAPREGHLLKDAFGMYLSLKKQFEEFNNIDIVFENNTPLAQSVDSLAMLVQEKLRK